MEQQFNRDLAAVAHIPVVPKILEVICRTTGMGFSAVARVTEARWIACAVRDEIAFGLTPGGELDVRTTICDQIRASNQMVVIDSVDTDPRFRSHPTPAQYGFKSYISVPLRYPDGRFFGTLCAIDPNPARLDRVEVVGLFTMFADLIGFHLDAYDRLHASEKALSDERREGALRDQFIAVLGHDLRNPLAAISTSANLLAGDPSPEAAGRMVTIIQRSTSRMTGLVENLMDLASGQLGGGLSIVSQDTSDLASTIEDVSAESRAVWPHRIIETDVILTEPVACDRPRIAQLASNLIANGLAHGDASGPIIVRARTDEGLFTLAVENRGTPIPAENMARLFHPFVRGGGRSHKGLGLGLYIASEIARAHGGQLTASSDDRATTFTLSMPLSRQPALDTESSSSAPH